MAREHKARPTGEWDADGAGHCITCNGRLIEAVYTGGWMHSVETPHAFAPFHYSDGAVQVGGGCLECGRAKDASLHTS